MRGKTPVAKIVAIDPPTAEKRHLAGAYRGKISWDEDAFDLMTDAELVEYGFDALLDGDLVPPPAE